MAYLPLKSRFDSRGTLQRPLTKKYPLIARPIPITA
jgi:hypothetical protein